MSQMIRKQIYIEKRQDRLLKKRARLRKASEAELIREAIQNAIGVNAKVRPFRHDPEAWDKIQRVILSRRAFAAANSQAYQWKREDAYPDRMSRDVPTTK